MKLKQHYLNMINRLNSIRTGNLIECSFFVIIWNQEHKISFILFNYFFFSVFYVFYEQYLTIWYDTIFSLSISLATIFAVSFILTGFDLMSALVILIMVTLILINMGGLMWLWNISLNAISLVNLVVVSGKNCFNWIIHH